jgi:hypothetical protein
MSAIELEEMTMVKISDEALELITMGHCQHSGTFATYIVGEDMPSMSACPCKGACDKR